MNKKVNYTRYYSRYHTDTPEHHARASRASWRRIAPYLDGTSVGPVLDVGCGMGFTMQAFLENGYNDVEGVDIDPGQIAVCKRFGLNAHLLEDTIEWLKNRSDRYQLITCFDVVEHVPLNRQVDFVRALAGALRKEGGKLLLSVPNANSVVASRWRYNDYTHTSSFTECSLDYLLALGGLVDIVVSEDNFQPRYVWLPRPSLAWWYMKKCFRGLRRLQMMSEIGPGEGWRVPLSPNLFATARRNAL